MHAADFPEPARKKWEMLHFPIVRDERGNLTFVEGHRHVPFDIARVYYLYDVPSGSERAGHAHRQLRQVIIAASGSFSVNLDDGHNQETITLNRSHMGLLMGPLVWRVINNFSSGAVCLVLASMVFDEADYIRDYGSFKSVVSADARPVR
jgi:hypothetical protein